MPASCPPQFASTDPAALVKRLRVAIATRQLPGDLAAWLGGGLERFLSGESDTLCAALGLRVAGRTGRVGYALALEARNAALRLAAESVPGGSHHARAEALARAVRRFESDTWPQVRTLDTPPARFNATQRALWSAFRAASPPRSARGIRAALAKKPALFPPDGPLDPARNEEADRCPRSCSIATSRPAMPEHSDSN